MINQMNPQQSNFRAALYNVAMQSGIDPRAVDMLLQALQFRQMQRQGMMGGQPMGGQPMGGQPMGGQPMARAVGANPGGQLAQPGSAPAMHPQQRQLMRQLRSLLGPNFRPMLRDMMQNGQIPNHLSQQGPQVQTPNAQVNAQPGTKQKNANHQQGLVNINNQININCGPDHQTQQIKGDEKGGWLAKHGGYKKNKDGSFDITKGKWQGHKALPVGNGKYNIVGPNGQSVGEYSSPKGKDKIASPLTFDLNGDGKVGTTGVKDGRQFDIDGDGKVDQTAWAGRGDGVLAFDGNKDGVAGGDGKELLGNNTDVDGDGRADGHANGFEALKALAQKNLGFESVADGKLDQWELQALEQKTGLTMNVDGQNRSLGELGISEIDLGYTEAGENPDENGNQHRQVGAGFVRNGQQGKVNDVWFKYQ